MRTKLAVFLFVAALAVSAAAAETALKGQVLDEDGKPVAGAAVTFYEVGSDGVAGISARTLSSVETDAEGRYAVSGEMGESTATWRSFPMLIARKEGLALGWLLLMPGVEEGDITLKRPVRLAGVVVDEAGKPVADAAVSVMLLRMEGRQPIPAYGADGVDPLLRRTDSDGRFTYDDIPLDATAEIIAAAPGFAKTTTMGDRMGMPFSVPAGKEDVKVTLPREGRIAGRVVDEAGKPCAGLSVIAAPVRMNPFLGVSAVTDADGRFSIGTLGPRDWNIALGPDPSGPQLLAKSVTVTVKSGETAEATLALESGGLLEVRVVEAADGTPIPDVQVGARTIADSQFGRPAQQVTDVEGVARFRLGEAEYAVSVSKQGYKYLAEGLREKVTTGQTAHLEVRLEKTVVVTGVVVDEKGTPLEGAMVQMAASGGNVVTDGAGKFESPIQREFSQWDSRAIVARHIGRNLAAVVESPDLFLGPVTITLKPAATLKGRAVDEAGKPIRGAEAQAYVWTGQMGHGVGDKGVADADGNYSIGAIPVGCRVTLTVCARGYGRDNPPVPVLDPAAADIGTSVLKRADKSIAGVVLGPDGKPVSGVRVYTSGQNQPEMPGEEVKTDAEGRFRIDGVVDGELSVYAALGGTLAGSAKPSAGDMNLEIALGQTGSAAPSAAPEDSEPAPLAGMPLPDLSALFTADELKALEGKRLLVVVFDVDSRPSRAALSQIAQKIDAFAKANVAVIGVDVSGGDADALSSWAATTTLKMPLAASAAKAEEVRRVFGVKSLPWLLLADEKRMVRAEGFTAGEAQAKVGALGK